ncbi:beta-lactamase/transpeptidase-like protein [Aspergillus floccosus]
MFVPYESSPLTPEFDSLVQELLNKWKVPGMTIAVVHKQNVYSKAYGIAEFPDRKMATDCLFSTCSTTKAFTAAAVSLLIDDQKHDPSPLQWHTRISSLIRGDFVLADNYATMNTTLEDALSHRSGLPGHEIAMTAAHANETLQDAVRKLRHLPLAYPPRTTFSYCNHMYMVISHVLQEITGESLGAMLKRRIWDPLGMHDTYFSIQNLKDEPSLGSKLVRGYTWVPEKKHFVPEQFMNYAPTTGTGAIVSNVLDYAKWLKSWIHQTGPMSKEGYAALLRPRTIMSEGLDQLNPPAPYHLYALGWFLDTYRGEQIYMHSGSWPGFRILVGFLPQKDFAFVMMANSESAKHAQYRLFLYLMDRLHGTHEDQPEHHPPDAAEEQRKPANSTDAVSRLFPSLSGHRIPRSLPLDEYCGTYRHAGYGCLALNINSGHLTADLTDRAIVFCLRLWHASGEYFVGELYTPGKEGSLSEFFRTKFDINADGQAHAVGLELEPALGNEMIWFTRTP